MIQSTNPEFTILKDPYSHEDAFILLRKGSLPLRICRLDIERSKNSDAWGEAYGLPANMILDAIKQLQDPAPQPPIVGEIHGYLQAAFFPSEVVNPDEPIWDFLGRVVTRRDQFFREKHEAFDAAFPEESQALESLRAAIDHDGKMVGFDLKYRRDPCEGWDGCNWYIATKAYSKFQKDPGVKTFVGGSAESVIQTLIKAFSREAGGITPENQVDGANSLESHIQDLFAQLAQAAGLSDNRPEVSIPTVLNMLENRDKYILSLKAQVKAWYDTAAQHARNTGYYTGLLDRIGLHFGTDVYTSDDGTIQQDILRAKIPELFEGYLRKTLPLLAQAMKPAEEVRLSSPHQQNHEIQATEPADGQA